MLNKFRHFVCDNNYKKKLKKIKNKEKIKVVFIVLENEKWGYQSLYNLLEKDTRFEPLILVGILYDIHINKNKTKSNLEDNYKFFKQKGMNVDYIYKNKKYKNLKDFKPDIVFYEQQWGLPKKLRPETVSKIALTFYAPYSIPLFEYKSDYMEKFHSYLFKYLADSDCNIERYKSYNKNNIKNCITVGYAKLDKYTDNNAIDLSKYWKKPENFKIIYAPHHSFEKSELKMGTFEQNGKFILELAKNSPNTTWIFKPHPRLEFALLKNKIMNKEEIEKYYQEWKNIGHVYLKGDYIDIFKSSDLMITDCCSFLAEYLPSKHPLIRPISQNSKKLNKLGQEVVKSYYETTSNKELEEVFNKIVYEKKDEKINIRKNLENLVYNPTQSSAEKILKIIKNALEN